MKEPKQEIKDFTDTVGPWPSEIDAALGRARASSPVIDSNPDIQLAHATIGKFGAALEAHAVYGRALPADLLPNDPVDPNPPPTGGWPATISKYQVTPWAATPYKSVRTIQAVADGTISSAVGSGGVPVWGTVGDAPATIPFPNVSGTTSWGQGACGLLNIKAGQYFSTYHENPAGGDMRCSM